MVPHTLLIQFQLSLLVRFLSTANEEGCAPLYSMHTPSALITITIKR